MQLPVNAPKCAHHNNHYDDFMNFMHRDEEFGYFPSRFDPVRHAARHPFSSAVLRGKRDRKQREREVQYFVPTIYANLWNTDMHFLNFEESFREMVAMCLVKDLKKRNRAKKLSADLPPLWNRVKANLSLKDAAELALKKMPSAE